MLEVAVTVRVWASFVAPELMPERLTVCNPALSLMVMLARAFRVGGVLTGLTVTVKDLETMLLLVPPSVTVTVTVAEPLAVATGVKEIEPAALGVV